MNAMRWEWALAFGISALGAGSSGCGSSESTAGNVDGGSGSGANGATGGAAAGTGGSGVGGASATDTGTDTGSSAACAAGLQVDGHAIGDIAENWSLPNNLLQMVQLHDFCGKVVFYEEGSQW